MKKLLLALVAMSAITANALVVTNDPAIHTAPPTDPVTLRCWDYMDSTSKWTAIGAKVFCGSTRVAPPKTVTYLGHTFTVAKSVDSTDFGIRFLITTEELPAYAPVAATTPTSAANTFPIIVVAPGWGAKSATDWTWAKDSGAKRWGTATGVRVGPGIVVNWKMEGGNCSAAHNDYGGGTFNAAGEYLGPISAANNPTTLTSWNASRWVGPHLHLVDEYMRSKDEAGK